MTAYTTIMQTCQRLQTPTYGPSRYFDRKGEIPPGGLPFFMSTLLVQEQISFWSKLVPPIGPAGSSCAV